MVYYIRHFLTLIIGHGTSGDQRRAQRRAAKEQKRVERQARKRADDPSPFYLIMGRGIHDTPRGVVYIMVYYILQ